MSDLAELTKRIVKDKEYYEDMEQLICTLNIFNPELLEYLHEIIIESYFYKDIRLRYFRCLANLKRTETIEQLMLDFLINDDYENKQLTKLCEEYFR